jgi:hypothetical protein
MLMRAQVDVVPVTPALVAGIVLVLVFTCLYGYLKTDERALPAVDRALGCADRAKGASPAPTEATPLHAASSKAAAV